jgi:hypothetical protein
MDHEAGEELEEDQPAAARPVEPPSLAERLLGVTTMKEDLNSAYTSTSARGLIERLTAADRRSAEKRKTAEPRLPALEEMNSADEETDLRIEDIPTSLRASDAFLGPEDRLSVADRLLPAVEEQTLVVEDLAPVIEDRRRVVEDPPPAARQTSGRR